MLFEPTNVVLNSLPVAPTAAGDCVGLGRNTTVPAFGLLLSWCTDVRLPGVAALRSYNNRALENVNHPRSVLREGRKNS